jgi:glutamate dehydrogenase
MMIAVARLLERAILWLLHSDYAKLDIAASVNEFRPRIEAIQKGLEQILPSSLLSRVRVRQSELMEDGIPESLAKRVASLDIMASAMDIISISRTEATEGVEGVARVYFGVGERFNLDDLYGYQSVLASRVIAEANGTDSVESWLQKRARVVERVDQTIHDFRAATSVDLAMLTVTSRQLRSLVDS